jgi:DNA polymerase III psi subunit
MSLDNFQISVGLTTELYKNSLVALDAPQIKSNSLKPQSLNFLGKNQKQILIVVNDSDAIHLNDSDTALLTGILNACKLNFNDVALLNLDQYKEIDLSAFQDNFNPKVMIAFGINLKSIAIDQHYDYYAISKLKTMTFLNASSLTQIGKNVEEKKQLWNCLKSIFSI